jgi:hypothetical protein
LYWFSLHNLAAAPQARSAQTLVLAYQRSDGRSEGAHYLALARISGMAFCR